MGVEWEQLYKLGTDVAGFAERPRLLQRGRSASALVVKQSFNDNGARNCRPPAPVSLASFAAALQWETAVSRKAKRKSGKPSGRPSHSVMKSPKTRKDEMADKPLVTAFLLTLGATLGLIAAGTWTALSPGGQGGEASAG